MATTAENVIVAGSETRPPMLEKGMYDSWKTRIMLYIRGKENGEMLKDSVEHYPYKFKSEITIKDTDGVTDICREERLEDLKGDDKLRYDSDIKIVNILLLELPINIYTLIDHYQTERKYGITFVIAAKQARDLHSVTFDQLYAFLKHNEKDAKEVREMRQSFPEPLALLANTYNPPPSYIRKDATCSSKRRKFEGKEQQGFLADSLEETDDCEDIQLQAIANFKADHVDAYDSDCDDEATLNVIFMANLSPVGSLNDDTVAPQLEYIENIVSTNEPYDELKGNNDVISYTDYMLTIGDDADNYVPPVQKNDMMLSVIKQMKSQVENCNKVNQESKSEIKSLTSELERNKDRVRVLGFAVKDGHSEQEAYLTLGYQNPLYLSQARWKKPALYNGHVLIAKEHNLVSVCDSEETLILAEESLLKKLEKQTVVNTKPVDYSKLNKPYEIFVPQTQLSVEKLYWSSIPSPLVTVSKLKVFPKKLSSTCQFLKNLNNVRDLLTKFDECIKRRTMLSPHQIGIWE
ncbi:hypothetical protein Tco_1036592 [Tanacetum coccineum]